MIAPLTEAEAIDFFALVFDGRHRIPGNVRSDGYGCWWCSAYVGMIGLSTFDDDKLTEIVFAAHDYGYRAFVTPDGPRYLRISITRRDRQAETTMESHPTLEEAVAKWRRVNPVEKVR